MARTLVFQAGESGSKPLWVTKLTIMENLRPGEGPLSEEEKLEKVLKCVRNPNWDFLQSLVSIPGNPFYKKSDTPGEDQPSEKT